MEVFTEYDSDDNLPDFHSRNNHSDTNRTAILDHETDGEKMRIAQRFSDMNQQIGELTSLVRCLTKRLASNKSDENDFNVQRFKTPSHSDKNTVAIL